MFKVVTFELQEIFLFFVFAFPIFSMLCINKIIRKILLKYIMEQYSRDSKLITLI